jgi:hypothetical protein
MAQRMVRDVQCGNNLRGIATGLEVFRQDHDDAFPGRLKYLFQAGMPLVGLNKLALCPNDLSKGTNGMNRMPSNLFGNNLEEDAITNDVWTPEKPCSYLYEVSEAAVTWDRYQYFYRGYIDQGITPAEPEPPAANSATWAQAKRAQVLKGNLIDDTTNLYGGPFSTGWVPAIRCFWHYHWTKRADIDERRKVLNVSWDLNVFWSVPKWEYEANPRIRSVP